VVLVEVELLFVVEELGCVLWSVLLVLEFMFEFELGVALLSGTLVVALGSLLSGGGVAVLLDGVPGVACELLGVLFWSVDDVDELFVVAAVPVWLAF